MPLTDGLNARMRAWHSPPAAYLLLSNPRLAQPPTAAIRRILIQNRLNQLTHMPQPGTPASPTAPE